MPIIVANMITLAAIVRPHAPHFLHLNLVFEIVPVNITSIISRLASTAGNANDEMTNPIDQKTFK